MQRNQPALFKGRHFEAEIIVLCVRWYLRFGLSFRNLEELMAERNLAVDAVTDALAALPFAQRVVIVLHHFEGLSYAEVASVTDSTEPAFRSHLFRARRALGTSAFHGEFRCESIS